MIGMLNFKDTRKRQDGSFVSFTPQPRALLERPYDNCAMFPHKPSPCADTDTDTGGIFEKSVEIRPPVLL